MVAPPRLLRISLGLFVLVFMSGAATPRSGGLGFQDLLDLARSGLDSSLIGEQVTRLGLGFEPTPRQIALLAEAGLSRDVLSGIVRNYGMALVPPPPSETVRIFEDRTGNGRKVLVLTNLDDAGNPLRDPGEVDEEIRPRNSPIPSRPMESYPVPASFPPADIPAPPVVVNIEMPPLPEAGWGAPVLGAGGIAGAYRYPEHLSFAGFGLGIPPPTWVAGEGADHYHLFLGPSSGPAHPHHEGGHSPRHGR
jgi:hypothetical protein